MQKITTKLPWLNSSNDTAKHQYWVVDEVIKIFKKDITVLEIGSPYGGAVEMMSKILKKKGKAYGYDTFVGHPKDLADDRTSLEAVCMEPWYHQDNLGRAGLDYDFQRKILDEEGLDNAILIKGRIDENSFDNIDKIHFAMMDLDLIKPTIVAYHAIKDKFVKGSFLFFHDAIPADHLPYIHDFVYNDVIPDKRWKVVIKDPKAMLIGLKRL